MNANSYGSPGTAGGNREDLRGPLSILEPEDTPFTSMCRKGSAPKATLVEIGADTLRKPRRTGTREGFSGSKGGNKALKRQRFGSYLHRWHDTYGVTDVQQALTEAGGNAFTDSDISYAEAKCIREVKRDIEATNCGDQDGAGGTDDEMLSRGAFKWLASSQTPSVPADFQAPAAQRLTGISAIVETGANSLNGVLKSLKANYGSTHEFQLIGGNDTVEDIDLFTRTGPESTYTRYRVQESAEEHEISLHVKVFRSTFGTVNVIPTEFNRVSASTGLGDAESLLILNMELWELLFLEGLHSQRDPDDAGGEGGYVKAIGGLFCKNPKGNAFIYNA